MPHTPTSFRPPSLWPQVKRMITRGTPHFRNPPDAEVTPGVSCRFDPFSQRQAGRWISDQFLLEMVNEMRFHGTLMVLSDSVGMMTWLSQHQKFQALFSQPCAPLVCLCDWPFVKVMLEREIAGKTSGAEPISKIPLCPTWDGSMTRSYWTIPHLQIICYIFRWMTMMTIRKSQFSWETLGVQFWSPLGLLGVPRHLQVGMLVPNPSAQITRWSTGYLRMNQNTGDTQRCWLQVSGFRMI